MVALAVVPSRENKSRAPEPKLLRATLRESPKEELAANQILIPETRALAQKRVSLAQEQEEKTSDVLVVTTSGVGEFALHSGEPRHSLEAPLRLLGAVRILLRKGYCLSTCAGPPWASCGIDLACHLVQPPGKHLNRLTRQSLGKCVHTKER